MRNGAIEGKRWEEASWLGLRARSGKRQQCVNDWALDNNCATGVGSIHSHSRIYIEIMAETRENVEGDVL